jgi:hypothetical protein
LCHSRYDTPTRWRYWRSKYDPHYDPLTDPTSALALDYQRAELAAGGSSAAAPTRVSPDWTWVLDEVRLPHNNLTSD